MYIFLIKTMLLDNIASFLQFMKEKNIYNISICSLEFHKHHINDTFLNNDIQREMW